MTMQRAATFRALGDPGRLKTVLLLREAELTVGELRSVLQAAQSTVSTQLRTLMDAELVSVRRVGRRAFYRAVSSEIADRLVSDVVLDVVDREALQTVLAHRDTEQDGLAARFERAEVVGRSWQALARGLLLASRLGKVADFGVGGGHLTLLLAERSDRVYAVDHNPGLLADVAARARRRQVDLVPIEADLSRVQLPETVDLCVVSLVLCEVEAPADVMMSAAQCVRPGGVVWVTALAAHDHESIARRMGHRRAGVSRLQLESWAKAAGLERITIVSGGREKRPPRLQSLVMTAYRPEEAP